MTVTEESPVAKRPKKIMKDLLGTPANAFHHMGELVVDVVMHDLKVQNFTVKPEIWAKCGTDYGWWVWEFDVCSSPGKEALSRKQYHFVCAKFSMRMSQPKYSATM